ncbi:MAG: hypothetical protein AB7T05_11205, partial [Fimbriimonadaceae bacterium]
SDDSGTQASDLVRLARKTGGTDLHRLFGGLAGPIRSNSECPACGWTRQQYTDTSLLGCPLCYEVFQVTSPAEPPQPPGTSSGSGIG